MVRTMLLVAGLFLVACGGSSDVDAPAAGDAVPDLSATATQTIADNEAPIENAGLLRLPDGDFTEEDVRQFTSIYVGLLGYCSGYVGAETDAELLVYVKRGYIQAEESKSSDHIRLVTDVDDADFLRLGKLTQEVCRAEAE